LAQLLGTLLKEVTIWIFRINYKLFAEGRQNSYFRRDQEQGRWIGPRNFESWMERYNYSRING
jgi:hypothetical protein